MPDFHNGFPKSLDTSPLTLEQLSDHELKIILSIEHQLRTQQTSAYEPDKPEKPYLAPVQVRSPNVLLLDGARGTGKTSLLLTMARRWSAHSNRRVEQHDDKQVQYKSRIERIQGLNPSLDANVPQQFHPLRILDFDPIPPQMSLISGIVHAWQPLVGEYDKLNGFPDDCDVDAGTLEDKWEQLFRVATVGWSPMPAAKGLLEQVLDRQEQVRDWQNVGQRWYEFVSEVIRHGKQLPGYHRLDGVPIFIIMIDDVDLQVERIREVLPALRLLYHPNVAFIVAAHWDHLIDTLKIDFLGKQNRLANRELSGSALSEANDDKWAGTLAYAAATKVFPRKNKWTLQKLSLLELLAFPGHRRDGSASNDTDRSTPLTMGVMLNEWPSEKGNSRQKKDTKLGNYLQEVAECQYELPLFITYRDAHQIFERASLLLSDGSRAVEAMRLLISDREMDAVALGENEEVEAHVEYRGVGELAALFPSEHVETVSELSEIVLSARPQFIFLKQPFSDAISTPGYEGTEINFTSAMLALTMQDQGFGVAAPSLGWNVRLALAWTRVRVLDEHSFLELALHWRFHRHPHPFQLFEWSRKWGKFIRSIPRGSPERLQRIAYGWMYYQLEWVGCDMEGKRVPLDARASGDWNERISDLVEVNPSDSGDGQQSAWLQDWQTQTLPLLARPEIGLPREIQTHLLQFVSSEPDPERRSRQLEWLMDQRERLITDAIIAAADEDGRREENPENTDRVRRIVLQCEKRYEAKNKSNSPWKETIGVPSDSTP